MVPSPGCTSTTRSLSHLMQAPGDQEHCLRGHLSSSACGKWLAAELADPKNHTT